MIPSVQDIIIAVDEDWITLSLLRRAIEKSMSNARIKVFTSPRDALLFAKEQTVAVAFISMEMKSMDSIGFCRQMKSVNPTMNLIFVSMKEDYMREAITLHASGYILKPFGDLDVAQQLGNLLYPI